MADSFSSKGTLRLDGLDYTLYRLGAVYKKYPQAERLPFCLKVLLENLLRTEVRSKDVAELAAELCGPLFAKTTGAQIPVDGGNDRVI